MSRTQVRLLAAAIVAVPLVGYPVVVLAGGGAEFHTTDDCVRPAPAGSTEALDLVFGRRDTPAAANVLLKHVQAVGYRDAEVRRDACGRWEVLYDGIESYAQGASSAAEARAAGLDAVVEIEPPG